MSTNAPTSRCITYMYCHVDGLDLEVEFFFSKKYFSRKFPIFQNFYFPFFFQTLFRFPSCFILWIIFQFIFLLALYFESSSNLSSLYTFFLYIKGTIVEKPNLNFFKEFFQALNVLQSIWGSRLELFWKILLIFGSQFQETRLEFTMRNPFNFWTIFNFVSFAFTFFLFLFLIVKKIPWVIWCGECCNVESHVVTSDACPS